MGNTESGFTDASSENSKFIEEQKRIIMAQQQQINMLQQQYQQQPQQPQQQPQQPQQQPQHNHHPNMFMDDQTNNVLPDKSDDFDKALKIFEIPRSYDVTTLKKKYIKLAYSNHPDKGGDPETFLRIQKAYKILLDQLNSSKHNHDHNQLRNNYKDFQETRPSEPVMNINSEHSFNRDLFNQAYEENREGNIFDKGYSDWIKKEDTNVEPEISSSLKKGNFNEDLFHSEFSKHKKKLNSQNQNSIIKYDQPQVDISYKGKDSLVVLGQDKISDFSGESPGGLAYRDLKDAYTNTLLIDAESVDISSRSYNINDQTSERKNISYELDEEGQMKEAKRTSDEEIAEKRRLERLRMLDEQASESYERIHTRMLGR
tara:strand:- start:686 stop:1801 length:1116 start_codon:yes stop_codon:yes gene_type:complete